MNEIGSQAWVACFESAFMELDPKRLIERIDKAEAAIDTRLFNYGTTVTIMKNEC